MYTPASKGFSFLEYSFVLELIGTFKTAFSVSRFVRSAIYSELGLQSSHVKHHPLLYGR